VTDSQLVLDFGHRTAYGREDFLVGAANREALDWIDRYPAWPSYGLAIGGPAGCGKTHLAHIFAVRRGTIVLPAADLIRDDPKAWLRHGPALAVEYDGSAIDERALLHLLNALKEDEGHLLLTGRELPARWPVTLPDLKSRLAALPVVRIAAPDDALLQAVLVKLFADRQLAVAPDVIAYALSRINRSFAAMQALAARADAAALAGQRAVTVPLLKTLLETAPMEG
jgi:chromosomal replication initiation ATPase DnaA